MAGAVRAGDMERAASLDLKNVDLAAVKQADVPPPSAAKAAARNADAKWLDRAKQLYADSGAGGLKDRKLVEGAELAKLPEGVLKTEAGYRKKCEDMNIGTGIKLSVYRFALDGKSGYLVQCSFDEYVFAGLLDLSGSLLAEGSSDSSEFAWNNAPWVREVKFTGGLPSRSAGRGCTVTDQNGDIDSWACRDSEGKIRCYADVNVNGNSFRINGGCAASFSDCWSNGASAVKDPCDSIADNGGSTPPPSGTGCTVTDQSGDIDPWACRDSEGKTRCYADATINGSPMRIYGNCVASFSECWATGSSPVDPCN